MENKLVKMQNYLLNKEKEQNLFELQYNGVYIYKLIRVPLFEKMQFLTGVLDSQFNNQRSKMKKLLRIIKYSIINMFKPIKKANVLYLTHGRKLLVNDKLIDIYLDDEIEKDISNNKSVLLIDRPAPDGTHKGYEHLNKRYYEHFGIVKRELFFKFFKFNKSYQEIANIFNLMREEIKEKFDIDIDINYLVKHHYYRFIAEKKHFAKLLKKVNPSEIKIVVAYGKEELISAAHELGKQVTEFQHGLMNKYHFAYYFPEVKKIPYFPDNLALFGEYWKESVELPDYINVFYYNNILMQQSVAKLASIEKLKNKVVFISSCDSKELQFEALNFVKSNENLDVHYKFHPTEFPLWKSDYPELLKASKEGLIKVIDQSITLQDAIIDSEYVIATSSTAVYEALMLNCKVFIIKIGGYVWLQDLIDFKYVKCLDNDYKLNESQVCLTDEEKKKFYIKG